VSAASKSFTEWLRGLSARDALLTAWSSAPANEITAYETDALAFAARAGKTGTAATIATPGGRARLPLLAAVHAAALRLPGFPSPFSGMPPGPVALVTRQTIRRAELTEIDAAGVLVSPALYPVRQRADGLVAPLPGGRPLPQNASHLLLFIGPSAAWVRPALPPSTVVIDAADEHGDFAAAAVGWAVAFGAAPILFADVAQRAWPQSDVIYPCGWSAIMAAEPKDRDCLSALAPVRGHAVVLAAGARPDLANVAPLLADARRRGPLPPVLVEASVLWRRLDDLVVPLAFYDAACPRWHTPTLTERLEDLARVRASDFPRGWRTWAETCWAPVKEGLASASDALTANNIKAALLVEAVDADLRAGLTIDVALPSRTARDALTRHLMEAGVPIPVDGRLLVRSLADAGAWGPLRATLLPAPPGAALRRRLVGADVGPLNVLCYDHELSPLERMLQGALDEPLAVHGPVHQLLPPAVDVSCELAAQRPEVVISIANAIEQCSSGSSTSLAQLADAVDIAGLAALKMPGQEMVQEDLPDADSDDPAAWNADGPESYGLVAAVPFTVVSLEGGPPVVIYVPARLKVTRILDCTVQRVPVLDVSPGMLVMGLDGIAPFDRLRPLLVEARGPVTRMLLAAWDQALNMALRRTVGPAGLATALAGIGATVKEPAVAAWADDDRIGPQDAANVTRIGRLADHPVVANNGHAIAEVMQGLRLLHQAVGRLVTRAVGYGGDAADELERLLGPDAVSILTEMVVYRVVAVGMVMTVRRKMLFTASRTTSGVGTVQNGERDGR
jgi:hypothetical protein